MDFGSMAWQRQRRHHRALTNIRRGPARRGIKIVSLANTMLPAGICVDQAGVDREAIATDKPFHHAAADHGFEQFAQQIGFAEAAMPRL